MMTALVGIKKHAPVTALLEAKTSQDDDLSPMWLTASPYHGKEHLLDLRTLDLPNRLLALALTGLQVATQEYASVTYEEAFDWTALMAQLRVLVAETGFSWTRQEFYVVEFRSKLLPRIDNDLLFKLDKESHREATQSGGLLTYWYGKPNSNRRNLATCEYTLTSSCYG